jgi:ABC-2 type transport system permease protein
VIFGLACAVITLPDLLLFSLQATLAGPGWAASNLRIAWAIIIGSLLWVTIMSLLSVAMSAWVKWRIAASGLIIGIFFIAAGFGEAINAVLRTYWGRLFNIGYLLITVWYDLFDIPLIRNMPRSLRGEEGLDADIPVGVAWIALLTLCFLCVLMIDKRLRAKEIIRG